MGASLSMSKSKSTVTSPHFWVIVVLFAVTTISHYHELWEDIPVIGQEKSGMNYK